MSALNDPLCETKEKAVSLYLFTRGPEGTVETTPVRGIFCNAFQQKLSQRADKTNTQPKQYEPSVDTTIQFFLSLNIRNK